MFAQAEESTSRGARSSRIVKASRAKATYWTYRALNAAIAVVPELLAEMGGVIASYGMLVSDPDRRLLVARHQDRVAGTKLDEASSRQAVRRAYRHYARYWVESARLPAMPPAQVKTRMLRVEGFHHLKSAVEEGRGAIIALPHLGSWDFGGAWLALQGMPMTTVAERLNPPELFEWFARQRSSIGLSIYPMGADAGKAVLGVLRSGGIVGLVCDRDLSGNGVEVEFFGERTTIPAGPAALALRTGAALLPAAVYSGPGRDHHAAVLGRVPAEHSAGFRTDVARVSQEVALQLESLIRRAPEQWHIFQPNWPSDYDRSAWSPKATMDGKPYSEEDVAPKHPDRQGG